jgi:hypothetical protein
VTTTRAWRCDYCGNLENGPRETFEHCRDDGGCPLSEVYVVPVSEIKEEYMTLHGQHMMTFKKPGDA